LKYERKCTKSPHMTRKDAKDVIKKLRAKGYLRPGKVWVFKCDECGFFHWGHAITDTRHKAKLLDKAIKQRKQQKKEGDK
jgi:ribosomal protein L37AE/L43A